MNKNDKFRDECLKLKKNMDGLAIGEVEESDEYPYGELIWSCVSAYGDTEDPVLKIRLIKAIITHLNAILDWMSSRKVMLEPTVELYNSNCTGNVPYTVGSIAYDIIERYNEIIPTLDNACHAIAKFTDPDKQNGFTRGELRAVAEKYKLTDKFEFVINNQSVYEYEFILDSWIAASLMNLIDAAVDCKSDKEEK